MITFGEINYNYCIYSYNYSNSNHSNYSNHILNYSHNNDPFIIILTASIQLSAYNNSHDNYLFTIICLQLSIYNYLFTIICERYSMLSQEKYSNYNYSYYNYSCNNYSNYNC